MKVRLLIFTAVFAALMSATGFAQQDENEGLERALSDLNNAYVAPAASNVSASGSMGLNISGDMRVRNTWVNPANTLMPNLKARDFKNVDSRVNLNLAFDINEGASAFVQLNANENWGSAFGGLGNVATGEGTLANPLTPNLNTGVINQAYFTVYDIFGDGGEFKLGRSFYTLGSGRILATDDWSQTPSSYSGIWYHNDIEGVNLELFWINDFFSGIGSNGSRNLTGDFDLYGIVLDYTTDAIEFLGDLTIMPYYLRHSTQAGFFNGIVGVPPTGAAKNWFGFELAGGLFGEVVDWDLEAVWVDSGALGSPGTGSFNAWALDFDINLEQWTGEIPGGINPVIEFGYASASEFGVTINPAYHDTAGLADIMGSSGIYVPGAGFGRGANTGGGIWNGSADVWQIGLRAEPIEAWWLAFKYVSFNQNSSIGPGVPNFPGGFPGGPSGGVFPLPLGPTNAWEIDLSLSHTFDPSGLSMFLSWSMVDYSNLSSNAYVVWFLFGLPF